MKKVTIVYIPIKELKPATYNPREISRHDFEALKKSIVEFGFVDPVIVNKDNSIIGGHQRVDAARELGIDAVPVVYVDVADEQAKSAHLLATWFLFNMPQYPNLNSWDQIKGHKEFQQTACPGPIWKEPADSLYERIKNNIPYTPPPAPQPQPEPDPQPAPPAVDYKKYLIDINTIMYGKGYIWQKMARVKEVLVQAGV